MNKQDFIDRLRMALNGRVSPGLVMDNVNYYEDYINTEIRKGRTEEEVLESLGDPRLIARMNASPFAPMPFAFSVSLSISLRESVLAPPFATIARTLPPFATAPENTEKQQDRRYITVITETAMANMAPIRVKWQMY